MSIDIKKLREDMKNDGYGAFYGGGFGGGIISSVEASLASESELLEKAQKQGIDLDKYKK